MPARRPLLALVLALASLAACAAPASDDSGQAQDSADTAAAPPQNLYLVTPCVEPCATPPAPSTKGATVFRGANPDAGGLRYLRDTLGVATLIDLEELHGSANRDLVEEVNHDPGARQLKVISAGMGSLWEPSDSDIDPLLAAMADATKNKHPIYVHCALGRDRTGMIIALHRVLNEKWKAQDAYDEWHRHGFDANAFRKLEFEALFKYFEKRAGDVNRA